MEKGIKTIALLSLTSSMLLGMVVTPTIEADASVQSNMTTNEFIDYDLSHNVDSSQDLKHLLGIDGDNISKAKPENHVKLSVVEHSNIGDQIITIGGYKGTTIICNATSVPGYARVDEDIPIRINDDGTAVALKTATYYKVDMSKPGAYKLNFNDIAYADTPYDWSDPSNANNPYRTQQLGSSSTDTNTATTNTSEIQKKSQVVTVPATVNYVLLSALNSTNDGMSPVGNRALGGNTSWFSDKMITISGVKYYRVATNEWVKATEVNHPQD